MSRPHWGAHPLHAVAVLVATLMIVAACGAGPAPDVPLGAGGEADAELERGREVYGRQCTVCHGNEGQGGRGKRINDGRALAEYPEVGDMTAVVTGGKGSGMPAFESKLEPAEIDAVVRYVREVLN